MPLDHEKMEQAHYPWQVDAGGKTYIVLAHDIAQALHKAQGALANPILDCRIKRLGDSDPVDEIL